MLGDHSWALAAQRWLLILVEYFATSGFGLDFAVPQVVLFINIVKLCDNGTEAWTKLVNRVKVLNIWVCCPLCNHFLDPWHYALSSTGKKILFYCIFYHSNSIFFSLSRLIRISQILPSLFQERLADWGRQNAKTKNRNTETIATTNTNSEIDDHLSQRPLSRTGWMASWQIGATLRGLGRTLPTPPTLFVRHVVTRTRQMPMMMMIYIWLWVSVCHETSSQGEFSDLCRDVARISIYL